jgi:ribosomal protein L12E/L44/L45/RPP1/RPP2
MSPQLKELLLPQFVQDRKSAMDETVASLEGIDLSYVYYTTNSSSSDVASPLTPTFSNRGAPLRYSSSTSSLELPPVQQEGSISPIAQHAAASKSSIRQLPDVQEEPLEREEEDDEEDYDDDDDMSDNFGMYCLCKLEASHPREGRRLVAMV